MGKKKTTQSPLEDVEYVVLRRVSAFPRPTGERDGKQSKNTKSISLCLFGYSDSKRKRVYGGCFVAGPLPRQGVGAGERSRSDRCMPTFASVRSLPRALAAG